MYVLTKRHFINHSNSDYSVYDNTNDARFESLRNYPRRIGLYKRHLDLEKEYEQMVKHYKKRQKLFILENTHQKQKVEARFTKLKKQVINSRPYNLRYSYNWDTKLIKTRESTFALGENFKEIDPGETHQTGVERRPDDRLSPEKNRTSRAGFVSPERPLERLKSHRSVSVDNITQVEETVVIRTETNDGGVSYMRNDLNNLHSGMTRSLTSLIDQNKMTRVIHVQPHN